MGKAADRHEHNLRKSERREEVVRQRLNEAGGVMSPVMQSIFRYFHTYASRPRPDLFVSVLTHIATLGLMTLSEHRNSIAGAITGIILLHPDNQAAWHTGLPEDLFKIVESSERLVPPQADEAISRPGQAEFLWMNWIVTRDTPTMQRVVRLANRHDSVGETALALLYAHANMPEVKAVMAEIIQRRQASVVPHYRGAIPGAPVAAVNALRDLITVDPQVRRRVVLVGWIPSHPSPTLRAPVSTEGTFLIVTVDGARPPGCPTSWHDQPVQIRKPNPKELQAHNALLSAIEDP